MHHFFYSKRLFLFVVFFLFGLFSYAAVLEDSVTNAVEKLKGNSIVQLHEKIEKSSDYQKVAIYYLLGKKHFESNDFRAASEYFLIILEDYKNIVSEKFKYNVQVNIALCERNRLNFEHSIIYYTMAYSYIQHSSDSIEKANLVYDFGETYFEWQKYELAGDYFHRAEILLMKNKQTDLLIDTYIKLGAISQRMNLHSLAISYYEKAKKMSEKSKNSLNYVNALVNLGVEFIFLQKFDNAAQFLDDALTISRKIKYQKGEIYALNQIARLFVAKNDYPTALVFLQQSEALVNVQTDIETKMLIFNNIATVYKLMQNYTKALFFFDKLNELILQNNLTEYKMQAALNLAELHKLLKNYSLAQNYLDTCMLFALNLNQQDMLNQARFQASEIFMLKGMYKEAENELLELVQKEATISDLYFKSGIFLRMSDLYKAKNMHKDALVFYEKYHKLQLEIIEKASSFELSKIQNESKLHKLTDDLKTEKLNNLLKIRKIGNQKKWVLSLSFAGILFLFLTLGLAKLYVEKNKSYKELIKRNIELAEQIPFKAEKKLVERFATEKNTKYSDLIASLITLFEQDAIYMQRDISLQKVAEMLNTNRTYLSAAIQDVLQSNFTNLINKYRIEKARIMLVDKEQKLSIEGIALSVGFNSKSTFNLAFKTITGVTPSEMRTQEQE